MGFDPRYLERNFTSVGTRPIRPDGIDKVTGRARYGADFNMAGQLVGRILRSPHAHAKIRNIDTSKAEKLAGVKAVDHRGRPARPDRWRCSACTTSSTTAWRARRRSMTAMRWPRSPRSMPAPPGRR